MKSTLYKNGDEAGGMLEHDDDICNAEEIWAGIELNPQDQSSAMGFDKPETETDLTVNLNCTLNNHKYHMANPRRKIALPITIVK